MKRHQKNPLRIRKSGRGRTAVLDLEACSWVSMRRSRGGGCFWWGRLVGVGGPDVSTTEAIKASVAWVSSRNRAMAWCFRCVSGVLSVSRCMVPGLIASVLDTWRTHCAVPAPEQSCPRSEAGRGTRRRVRIVVNEGALRQHGAGADPRTGASSSGTKPALKAAAPLTARTPAPGLRCEAPRGVPLCGVSSGCG